MTKKDDRLKLILESIITGLSFLVGPNRRYFAELFEAKVRPDRRLQS